MQKGITTPRVDNKSLRQGDALIHFHIERGEYEDAQRVYREMVRKLQSDFEKRDTKRSENTLRALACGMDAIRSANNPVFISAIYDSMLEVESMAKNAKPQGLLANLPGLVMPFELVQKYFPKLSFNHDWLAAKRDEFVSRNSIQNSWQKALFTNGRSRLLPLSIVKEFYEMLNEFTPTPLYGELLCDLEVLHPHPSTNLAHPCATFLGEANLQNAKRKQHLNCSEDDRKDFNQKWATSYSAGQWQSAFSAPAPYVKLNQKSSIEQLVSAQQKPQHFNILQVLENIENSSASQDLAKTHFRSPSPVAKAPEALTLSRTRSNLQVVNLR